MEKFIFFSLPAGGSGGRYEMEGGPGLLAWRSTWSLPLLLRRHLGHAHQLLLLLLTSAAPAWPRQTPPGVCRSQARWGVGDPTSSAKRKKNGHNTNHKILNNKNNTLSTISEVEVHSLYLSAIFCTIIGFTFMQILVKYAYAHTHLKNHTELGPAGSLTQHTKQLRQKSITTMYF